MRPVPIAVAFALCAGVLAVPVLAQAPKPEAAPAQGHFQNLKVLPKDISEEELRAMMNGFTRALGVRCEYCHVHEGKAFTREDFPKDDKVTKEKARQMIKMVRDINANYIANLTHPQDPPVEVQCVTCHHGAPVPRTLQAVLQTAYAKGGLDSTLAQYQSLRDRTYGRFTYDFGDVPLADVGTGLASAGHFADAESLLALNVAMNPKSPFAKRQYASITVANGFRQSSAEGAKALAAVRAQNGADSFNEEMLNGVGYMLLGQKEYPAALAAFQANVQEHPQSGNVYDSLGEAYLAAGDKKKARAAYEQSLKLDPKNDHARQQLEVLKK